MYSQTDSDIRVFRRFLRRPTRRRLEYVVRTYYSPLWRIALRLSGNEDDANDIAQDVFLSLILNRPEPNGVRSPMGFLTYRAISRARHAERAAARRRTREAEAVRRLAAAEDMAEEDLEEVRHAVRELPEPLRTTVELRYLSSLRNSEIAATLAVSERTVERHLGRARQILRDKLGKGALGALLSFGTWNAADPAPSPPLGTLLRVLDVGSAMAPATTATSSPPGAATIFGVEVARTKTVAAISIAGILVVGLSLTFMSLTGDRIVREPKGSGASDNGAHLAASPLARSPDAERQSDSVARAIVSSEPSSPMGISARLMKERYLLTGRIVEATTVRDPTATNATPAGVQPVEGARVDFKPHPRRADPKRAPEPQRVVTGPDGTFAFGGIPWGMWLRLEIDAPDRGLRTLSFNLHDPEGEGRIELGDIEVEPGLDLAIDVSGPEGQPVSGARVMVKRTIDPRLQAAGMYESHREAEEARPGLYRLARVVPGTLRVTVLAPGYSRFREQVAIPEDGQVTVRLESGQVLRGVVTTLDGAPLAGAELEIRGPRLILPFPTTRSDDAGRFRFDLLSAGEFHIRARAAGYVDLKKHGLTPGGDPTTFRLEPESVYSGRVLSSGGGAPVPEARVTLTRPGRGVAASTDVNGRFSVHGLGPGSYHVTVDHEEHAPLYAGVVDVEAEEEISGVELRLERGVRASGTITDSETGNGVEGAWVTLTPVDAPEEAGRVKRLAKTSENGNYTVAGLHPGRYSMTIRAGGYVGGGPRSVLVEEDGGEMLDVSLTAGSSISGTIFDGNHQPIAGAAVFLSLSPRRRSSPRASSAAGSPSVALAGPEAVRPSQRIPVPPAGVHKISAQSDANGMYVLESAPPWNGYMITVTHRDHAFARIDGIAVGVDETVGGVDFVLLRGGSIQGQVVDEAGRGVAGVEVRYALEETTEDGRTLLTTILEDRSREGNDSYERFLTRDDGSFTVPRLPEGTYSLTAQLDGQLPATVQGVAVREGRRSGDLRLVLRPGEALTGRVVDPDGTPIAGATILTPRRKACVCVEFPTEVTDEDGRFAFRGLSPNAVRLTIKKAGFMTVNMEVELPTREEVLITLRPAGRVRGLVLAPVDVDYDAVRIHVTDRDGKPVPGSEVVRTDTSGEFFIDLAPGFYRLVATAPGLAPGRSEVFGTSTGDELSGVDIPLSVGGHLKGIVVSGDSGRAVEGVRTRLEPADGSRWTSFESTSDPSGRFAFENIAEGDYQLVAEHSLHVRTILKVTVVEGENPELGLTLNATGESGVPSEKVRTENEEIDIQRDR